MLKAILFDFDGTLADTMPFIGDSVADIRAGKSAGVKTFAVQWLEHFQSTSFDVEYDELFKNVDELLQIIEQTNELV